MTPPPKVLGPRLPGSVTWRSRSTALIRLWPGWELMPGSRFGPLNFDSVIPRPAPYGPLGTFEGGKEKAPAAISRKVALTPDGGDIEVWGDGQQTRSFMYIDDCLDGLLRLMASSYREPLNLGTDELISVDGLVDLVCEIAGKQLVKQHDLTKPQGVRGRNSDNSRLREVLGWQPQIRLRDGLRVTYLWIERELRKAGRLAPVLAYAAD